jgi:hypothetical protein
MNSGNVRRVGEVVVSGVATYLAREVRQQAVETVEKKGAERTEGAIKNSSEPVTVEEAYKLECKAVQEARSEDPILHAEDTIKETASSVSRWFF